MENTSENRPLWAPWRIEYVRSAKDGPCFICQKARPGDHDESRHVITRGDNCYVLLNQFPYTSGHMLIAPYRHIDDISELTDMEAAEVFGMIARAQKVLRRVMQPQGFNVGCNIGRIAGAAVEGHIHIHLVPRWSGDTNFMPVLADCQCIPEALDATCRLLRQGWSETES